uniref:NADH-ubiquinone oxidoreductase chain 6 n=1 Tax=Coleoptera sp. ACP-2013 TaxID=2485033 RepID=A0A3G3MEP8_9COLE|nr:NADH dehydrogenase subunit 6 [Coleoptera sp. ACP-2013]
MKIMLIMLSLTFLTLNHPISMGFNIIMMTIIISLMTGMLNTSFWFSYILFLVLIGGMLILFLYMTSIASNEKFKFSSKMLIINSLILMLSSILILWTNSINLNIKIKEINMFSDHLQIMIFNLKYFTPSMTLILISAMIYLLITLIMTVKITKKEKGPIRQK